MVKTDPGLTSSNVKCVCTYLGLNHVGSLVSQVLQGSSNINLFCTCKGKKLHCLAFILTPHCYWIDPLFSSSLPLAILFNTMSIKMYVPVRPAPSLMGKKQDNLCMVKHLFIQNWKDVDVLLFFIVVLTHLQPEWAKDQYFSFLGQL